MPNHPSVAVIGCGYWGKNLVRNFHALGALTAICEPVVDAREAATTIAPDVKVFRDYHDVLELDDIRAVAIATPAGTHMDLAIQAMQHGKDVFVEKPLALNHRQGMEMQQVADAHSRILMVGHLLEYHPAVLALRSLADDGELGKVNYLYSNRLNFGKIRTEENALWSFAPHDVSVMLRIIGDMPLEVTCVGGSYVTPNLADVTVSNLQFPSGVRAHIFVSWLNPFKEQKLVVVGEQKMAVFNDIQKTDKLVLYDQRVDLDNRRPVLQKGDAVTVPIDDDEPLRRECQHFLDSVQTHKPPLTDAASGIKVLRVLQACQLSLELGGRPVPLSDVN